MLPSEDTALPIDFSFLIARQFGGGMLLTDFVGCLAFLLGLYQNVT